ncbi:MAG: hypothetical protein AB7O37_16765 [Vicinamibacteria bacterium]
MQHLDLLVACLSLLLALANGIWTRKLHARQVGFQNEVAQLQIEALKSTAAAARRPELRATVESRGSGEYKLVIRNEGAAPAYGVEVSLTPVPRPLREARNPIVAGGLAMPVPEMAPNESIHLVLAITLNHSGVFDALLTWRNAEGQSDSRTARLTLP